MTWTSDHVLCLQQVVQISQASPAWQDYIDYIDAIVLDGLKQSSLSSLRTMLNTLVHANMVEVCVGGVFGVGEVVVKWVCGGVCGVCVCVCTRACVCACMDACVRACVHLGRWWWGIDRYVWIVVRLCR